MSRGRHVRGEESLVRATLIDENNSGTAAQHSAELVRPPTMKSENADTMYSRSTIFGRLLCSGGNHFRSNFSPKYRHHPLPPFSRRVLTVHAARAFVYCTYFSRACKPLPPLPPASYLAVLDDRLSIPAVCCLYDPRASAGCCKPRRRSALTPAPNLLFSRPKVPLYPLRSTCFSTPRRLLISYILFFFPPTLF